MRVKLVINTWVQTGEGIAMIDQEGYQENAEIWSGEIDIKDKNVYLTKVSIIGEGVEHPICDIPFSLFHGYWQWVPPVTEPEEPSTDI
jgi:hypothetical protein